MARKPDKKELAKIKILSDSGESPSAIAKKLGRSHHTIIKYLDSEVYRDPSIKKLIEVIREKELEDLYLLIGKSRKRLHDLLDAGESKMIETVAVMDRCFEQRRLLENKSTSNLSAHLRYLLRHKDAKIGSSQSE
jgi:predicted transcriptional regulator